jgi:hypothetical protein
MDGFMIDYDVKNRAYELEKLPENAPRMPPKRTTQICYAKEDIPTLP